MGKKWGEECGGKDRVRAGGYLPPTSAWPYFTAEKVASANKTLLSKSTQYCTGHSPQSAEKSKLPPPFPPLISPSSPRPSPPLPSPKSPPPFSKSLLRFSYRSPFPSFLFLPLSLPSTSSRPFTPFCPIPYTPPSSPYSPSSTPPSPLPPFTPE